MSTVDKKTLKDLKGLEEDEFLAGPDRYAAWVDNDEAGDLLDIDDRFGKDFEDLLREMKAHDPKGLNPEEGEAETAALAASGYKFRQVEAGVLLVAPDGTIAGGYLSCDVSIATGHQGQGLGAELILERALRFGDLPTWDLDEAAYSCAGEAAHRSAWNLLQDEAYLTRKVASFETAEPTEVTPPAPRKEKNMLLKNRYMVTVHYQAQNYHRHTWVGEVSAETAEAAGTLANVKVSRFKRCKAVDGAEVRLIEAGHPRDTIESTLPKNTDFDLDYLKRWSDRVDGKAIRRVRDTLGMTEARFAKMMDVTVSTLHAWENDVRRPRNPALRLITVLWKGFSPRQKSMVQVLNNEIAEIVTVSHHIQEVAEATKKITREIGEITAATGKSSGRTHRSA
jgi:DNA-binding transcriptional regulator YiaG